MRPSLEIAVDDVDSARLAEEAGADRLELCTGLDVDGLTPGPELVAAVLDAVEIPVCVLVRPRPGGFVYRGPEARLYVDECRRIAASPIEALVIGALTEAGKLDEALLQELIAASAGRRLVFHRAFDLLPDPVAARDRLGELGFERILTSGGAASAAAGAQSLHAWADRPGPRLVIAGGVRAALVSRLPQGPRVDLHASARRPGAAYTAAHRGPFLGGAPERGIDPEEIAALASHLREALE